MDLHGIDLNLLVAFDALMAERSVTRAGARIGRSQPAMSAALTRLRALLADELFVRGATSLQPTPRAVELAEPLGRALADIQRTLAFTHAFDPLTSASRFSLGLSEHAAYVVLPRLLEQLDIAAPGVTLNVRSFTNRDDAVALLDSGEIDIAVGVPPTTATGRILTQPLFIDRFVCVLRRGHPFGERRLDLETFLSLSHLLVSPENERYGRVDAALSERGLKRRLGLTLPHMYSAPMLVARSDLIATLMSGVVAGSGQRESLQVFDPPLTLEPVVFVLSWHRRNEGHPSQRWFRQLISSLDLGRAGESQITNARAFTEKS